jgi:hypothetical protein
MPSELQRFVEFLAANPSPVGVIVGKYYMVPCAEWPYSQRKKHYPQFIPLLGTVHEDKDIIGFTPWHIHVDTRFLTMKLYQQEATALARPFSLTGAWLDTDTLLEEASANLVLRKTKARRANPPEWPIPSSYWLPALESTYANASAACGVCPHRQIPLSAGRDMGNGVTQCPGHGLCWDRNGKLIKNKKASK